MQTPCLDLFTPLEGSLDDAPPPFFCGNTGGAQGGCNKKEVCNEK